MPPATSGSEQTKGRYFITSHLAVPLIAFLALHSPHLAGGGGCRQAQVDAAQALVSQLAQAVAATELDYSAFPPR